MLDQPFRRLLVGLVMVLSAAAAPAQPADECTGAALDGSDSLPFGGATTPANASFNVSGTGCTNPGFALDAAVCQSIVQHHPGRRQRELRPLAGRLAGVRGEL